MKQLLFIVLLFLYSNTMAQTIHVTSFQHTIRWLDEVRFPPYVTNDTVKAGILNATASALGKHFKITDITKPTKLEYRNIMMFGKPNIKDPEPSDNATDLQVSVLSFITRATTGYDVFWSMKVVVQQNDKEVYRHEIKHQLDKYHSNLSWFTPDEFIQLFSILLDELFENKEPLAGKIQLGTPPVNKDSILRAQSENWVVQQNKALFGFAKPAFGPYVTLESGKTDSAVIKSKTKIANSGSLESYRGKLYADNFNTVDINKTKFCHLLLGGASDSSNAFFTVYSFSREERESVLGFILSGNNKNEDANKNKVLYYNRNVSGMINTGNDSIQWTFYITHFVNGVIESGYLLHQQDSLIIYSNNLTGVKNEIVVTDSNRNYIAALESGFSKSEIWMQKELTPSYQKAIAALYALIISIKNLPD